LKSQGVELKFAKTKDGFIDEDKIIELVDNNTQIIHLSWVQYNNGYRTDLKKLGDFCQRNNILLSVDGIQGMGAVHFDVKDYNIDLFSFGCQKWMLGPTGTGFMYLSEKAENLIDTPWQGWLSVDWGVNFSDLMRYDLEPRKGPAKFEIATYSYHNIMAINTAVEFFLSFDSEKRWDHLKFITHRLMDWIDSDDKYELVSSREEKRRSGIVVFKPSAPKACIDYLISKNIIVSLREGCIRVSPHFYNNTDDIDILISALDNFDS
jgi:selenocysteine lyase/cysteine desulfurase